MSRVLDQALIRSLRPYLDAEHYILNIPSGDGSLSRQLEERGGRVTSSDLFPEFSHYRTDEVVRADMNEALPFDADSFDAIVCQEGVEHLENLPRFFAECRRVLKDGGRLVVSTPNYLDLSSRLSFFLTGLKGFRSHYPNEQSTIWGVAANRVYHGHAFTLPFFQLRYLLRINQFDAIRVDSVKQSGTAQVLYCLMRPWMGLAARLFTGRRQRQDRASDGPTTSDALQQELLGFATSRSLLLGKTIVVEATLCEGSFQPDARFAFD